MRLTAGEPSRVAVLAVDEGILQVARYRNPDPLGFFFQKRMLEVETRQILDLILPEFKRFLALAAPGGDADGGFARHLNPFNRKRKPPVAYWSGVIDVGPERPRAALHRARLLQRQAAHRRHRRQRAPDGRGGSGHRSERRFHPHAQRAGDGGAGRRVHRQRRRLQQQHRQRRPIRLRRSSGRDCRSSGSGERRPADRGEEGRRRRSSASRPTRRWAPAALTFTARRGRAEARIEESVSVRPAVAFRTQLTLGRVDDASAVGAADARPVTASGGQVEAAVSSLPLVWGQGLTAFLDNYEYSCTEQLVSKGMSRADPDVAPRVRRDQKPRRAAARRRRSRCCAAARTIRAASDLWSSSPETAEFPTVYAAHFLVEASERGQKIPAEVLTSVNDWLTRLASTPASTLADGRLRAYAVYLLVRQGIKPNAAIVECRAGAHAALPAGMAHRPRRGLSGRRPTG